MSKKQVSLNQKQKKEIKKIAKRQVVRVQELKFFVATQLNGSTIGTTYTSRQLSNVPQGDNDTSRDGDRLELCGSMEFIYQFTGPEIQTAGVNDVVNTVRLIIFQYHPTAVSGTSPQATEILQNGPSGVIDVHSLYNHDQRQNYTILKDKMMVLVNNQLQLAGTAGWTTYQSNHCRLVKFKINTKKCRKMQQFVAGTTDGTNQIFELLVSDSSVAPYPTVIRNSKIFFRDS